MKTSIKQIRQTMGDIRDRIYSLERGMKARAKALEDVNHATAEKTKAGGEFTRFVEVKNYREAERADRHFKAAIEDLATAKEKLSGLPDVSKALAEDQEALKKLEAELENRKRLQV